ncbi:MAG: DUF2459 domain-containing protein, partial [Coleofasciculaceae cyanobacterium SM2_3_26]|nr:DUF2459 domain-containing protein [Coleofasciculaceae cyanobacterium SM2_3_26]
MQEFPFSNSLGRILGRVLGRWLLVTSLGTVSLVVIGYFMPRQWGNPPQKPCAATVYISGNDFHTNLTVPVQTEGIDWREELNLRQLGRDRQEDYRYLSFGWGDR